VIVNEYTLLPVSPRIDIDFVVSFTDLGGNGGCNQP
jgi:hypothetical protein